MLHKFLKPGTTAYTFAFAALICVVCSFVVSTSAVTLKERQDRNKLIDKQKKVLQVTGLIEPGQAVPDTEVTRLFEERIEPHLIDLETGNEFSADDLPAGIDAKTYDVKEAVNDNALSEPAPSNLAGVPRVPKYGLVYFVKGDGGAVEQIVLPVHGKGLWSTMYGFLALDNDTNTVRGITFYEHGETPGLGGEVDNPSWKALWPERQVYDTDGEVALEVVKGQAPPPSEDPYKVDGLSGATITSRGVTNLLAFWMGDNGYRPFLTQFRNERS